MNGSAIAFRLPVAQLGQLFCPDSFWPIYRRYGILVNSLECGADGTVDTFIDYLISEARISIPLTTDHDLGFCLPEGVTVWMCLSPHDARVLYSRLAKRKLVVIEDPSRIFAAYDPKFQRTDLAHATCQFFANLKDHITSDEERLLVATIGEETRFKYHRTTVVP